MTRKQAREHAFKLIYGLGFDGETPTLDGEDDFAVKLYNAVCNNLSEIDELIKDSTKNFAFNRIFKTDLAAIRMGIAEIKYVEGEPHAVAINSAVELAKKFGTEKSASFVNGVLATVIK